LEDIAAAELTRSHLALYGGTALNFIHVPKTIRLSVDLDFNYRHQDAEDWGKTRDQIDDTLKSIIYSQGYSKKETHVQVKYPLTRITIKYVNTLGSEDELKIETGYMHRIPILKTDTADTIRHIATQETFQVLTPVKEELFASKWSALLARRTPRDLFDSHQISRLPFDHIVFRKCAIIESLMQEKQRLHRINIAQAINSIPIDTGLRNLLQTEQISHYNFQQIKERVINFSEKIIAELTRNEAKAIDQFYDNHKFEPHLINQNDILNDKICEHPAILWTLEKLKHTKN